MAQNRISDHRGPWKTKVTNGAGAICDDNVIRVQIDWERQEVELQIQGPGKYRRLSAAEARRALDMTVDQLRTFRSNSG